MYQDQDAGLSGPVIVYNTGEMEKTMSENREFVIFMGDNQESNSFMAWHNVAKYRPWLLDQFANLTDEYPTISSTGNESIWYPQLVNNPYTNITTDVLPNFFPVRLPARCKIKTPALTIPLVQWIYLRQQPTI
jgi:hypothetical protein